MINRTLFSPFKEEIIASTLVLLLVTSGSFYTIHKFLNQEKAESKQTESLAKIAQELNITPDPTGTVLGQVAEPTTVPLATPTIDPFVSEVFFGKGGMYDYNEYKLQIDNPRLSYNLKSPEKRKFLVDLTLTNKSMSGGLPLQVLASIIKDGNIIVPKTAMSISENLVLKIGETKQAIGSLALIEGTDVKEVLFEPLGEIPKIMHPLKQD